MFEERIMFKLEELMSEVKIVEDIESEYIMRCDCIAGCTDNCADCATMSDNQW